MTIDEILSNVTVLNDCSTVSAAFFIFLFLGGLTAGIGIWWFFRGFWETGVLEKICAIILVVAGLGCLVYGFWCSFTQPKIDYYICTSTNDVELEQIAEYFNISELSKCDDLTVCHITPKSEYYDEVLAIRNTDK